MTTRREKGHGRPAVTRRAMLGGTAMVLLALPLDRVAAADRPRYKDPRAPIAMRVDDLIGRMTLEEKAAQLCCVWQGKRDFINADATFSPEKAATALADGIGQITRPGDRNGLSQEEVTRQQFRTLDSEAAFVNAVQRFLLERTRLGIPAIFHDELLHGVLAGDATIFPSPPGLGSSWDPALVEEVYTVAARQARARGTTVALSPVIDLARDPRWGRVEEFFGEDPRHVAEMGVAAVHGIQGRTRPLARDRVYATLKHFVHGSPQGGLNTSPADMSERMLREAYLVPFAECVRRTDPAAILPSYNEVMGVPAHENRWLLQTVGREWLGFRGAYFADYEGIANLADTLHVAKDHAEAAVLAMRAGVDVDLPEGQCYKLLPGLVRAGRVPQAQVDAAVKRVLALKFEAGLFENPYVEAHHTARMTDLPGDVALARRAAQRTMVLLKNEGGLLPIRPRAGLKVAVIGPNAAEALAGGYSGENPRSVSVLDGIRRGAPAGVSVDYAEGVRIAPPDARGVHWSFSPQTAVPEAEDKARIAAATTLAQRSDLVVLVVGDTPSVTRETVARDLPGDRSTLGLWGRQDQLIEAMAATGKPIVALLLNGRALAIERLASVAGALIEGWYLGQEGGNAAADILFGRANPGGKLAVSFPRSVGELPVYYDRHPTADTNVYIEGERRALFPFGHGLSYTSFRLSPPRLSTASIAPDGTVEVAVDVANTGARAGDEVVQLYIRDEVSSVPRPKLELRKFERVTLAPGERRTVRFTLGRDDLALWDIDMRFTVEPGAFTISTGNSSVTLQSATLTVTGAAA